MKDHDECYAVLRADVDERDVPIENRITVKVITWDLDDAKREVERLNGLNASRGCRYYWQTTRARRRAS